MVTRVSLSELQQSGVQLRPAEAAALVAEICRQYRAGRLRGVPSALVIRLTQDGEVVAEGPINADGPPVTCAAQLLDDLLPGFDAAPEFRAPGGLRLAIARALRTLDLPPYGSLDELSAAIGRFAAPDVTTVARELYQSWAAAAAASTMPQPAATPAEPAAPAPLTISDVRRARRATGLTLEEVSVRSHIPASLLRELEWGYLRNWPNGLYGRSQLVRYARAAGLDEHLVIEIATPLIEEAAQLRSAEPPEIIPAEQPIEALVPIGVRTLTPLPAPVQPASVQEEPVTFEVPLVAQPDTSLGATSRLWGVAVAIAAILAIAVVPVAWEYIQHSPQSLTRLIATWRPSSGTTLQVPAKDRATKPKPAEDVRRSSAPRTPIKVPDGAVPSRSGGPSPITPQPATFSPTFSNIGTAVFYTAEEANEAGSPGAILKITRIVDDHAQNFHARLSPDGALIAFDSDREGIRAVFVANADGQHVQRVSGEGFAAVPSWSPNGRQLAFAKAEPDNPRVWNLWTADVRSGEVHRVTAYPEGQPWGGSWFPDGRRIAYGHDQELVVLDLESGTRRTFGTPHAGHLAGSPAVSPDGRRMIFQIARDGGWLLDVRNGSMRRVLDDPSAEGYTWSPDGHRVAFHSRRLGGWGVWILGQ
jgi:hypothetical protein